jgi:hypothetical protein
MTMATYEKIVAESGRGPIQPGDILTVIADDTVAGSVVVQHDKTGYKFTTNANAKAVAALGKQTALDDPTKRPR